MNGSTAPARRREDAVDVLLTILAAILVRAFGKPLEQLGEKIVSEIKKALK
jgi:hypothetical protein